MNVWLKLYIYAPVIGVYAACIGVVILLAWIKVRTDSKEDA